MEPRKRAPAGGKECGNWLEVPLRADALKPVGRPGSPVTAWSQKTHRDFCEEAEVKLGGTRILRPFTGTEDLFFLRGNLITMASVFPYRPSAILIGELQAKQSLKA